MSANARPHTLRAGMVGLGMIFDETYRPMFEELHADGLYRRDFGLVDVELAAVASRTGTRAARTRRPPAPGSPTSRASRERTRRAGDRGGRRRRLRRHAGRPPLRRRETGPRRGQARPDRKAVGARAPGTGRARSRWRGDKSVLAKVVYHKLADPDHKKLRTLVADGVLQHVNNGYCSLLEPKIDQRRPVRRVDRRPQSRHLRRRPLHQADRLHVRPDWLIDASPAPASAASSARPTARRGTRCSCRWSTRTRTAARRRSTSTRAGSRPTTSPATSSRRCSSASTTASGTPTSGSAASSCTVEGRTPASPEDTRRTTTTTATFLEPWGERSQRGYGVEVLRPVRRGGRVRRVRRRAASTGAIALDEMRALRLQRPRGRPQGRGRRAGDGSDPAPTPPRATPDGVARRCPLTGALTLHRPRGRPEPIVLYRRTDQP